MKLFEKSKTITHFSPNMTPNYTVDLGETVVVETHDCYGGQVYSEEVLRPDIDMEIMNLATGPFYVNGLTKNDVLKLDIKDIHLDSTGIMITSKGLGVLGNEITEPETRLLDVKNNYIHFNQNLRIPVNPMIGVIGIAPESDRVHCAVPGSHGGNLDTKDITIGNAVYLPVFQEGGLFALGDMHASMGDGEMNGTGVEIGGRAILAVSNIKGKQIQAPIVETDESFMFITSAKTLNEAIKTCAKMTVTHLEQELALDFETAYRLLSAVCDIRISQVVNKLVTVRIVVPKSLLPVLFL